MTTANTCSKCGHTPEMTIGTRIMQAGMQMNSDGVLEYELVTAIQAISPDLENEFAMEGTQHPLASKTLSEIRTIADAGDLPTGGSEVRIKRRSAAMKEWNRRIQAGELTQQQIKRFQHTPSLVAMQELGWVNPYA